MDIGEKIKSRRLELRLTLEQVGDAVGVGKSTVRKWEQGMIRNMRRDKIEKLARILEMDPVDFIVETPTVYTFREDTITFPQELSEQELSEKEAQILEAFRQADERSQDDALQMLLAHKRKEG